MASLARTFARTSTRKYILRSSFPAHVTSTRVHTAREDFILALSVLYFFFYENCDDLFDLLASSLWLVDV
jgi:hypothetical protein